MYHTLLISGATPFSLLYTNSLALTHFLRVIVIISLSRHFPRGRRKISVSISMTKLYLLRINTKCVYVVSIDNLFLLGTKSSPRAPCQFCLFRKQQHSTREQGHFCLNVFNTVSGRITNTTWYYQTGERYFSTHIICCDSSVHCGYFLYELYFYSSQLSQLFLKEDIIFIGNHHAACYHNGDKEKICIEYF